MRYAVVTGASTGIGRAIAIELSKNDCTLLLTARREDRLLETKNIIEKQGGKAEIFPADLAEVKEIKDLAERIIKTTNKIDILVNSAAIWHGTDEVYADIDFEDFSSEVVRNTLNVGTLAPMLLSKAFIPLMPENSKIVNISGTFENGGKGWLPYYVSKRAIEDFTVGLAEELKDKNIQVNCVSPSDTATEEYKKYFPQYIEDAIDPTEIAQQVIYLCSEDANNVTGTVWVMKKGEKPHKSFHK